MAAVVGEPGYVPARLDLAHLYWNRPHGIEAPESKGQELFGGGNDVDLPAQIYMGLAYECGRGVPKDLVEARKRFASAEAQLPPMPERAITFTQTAAIKRLTRASDGAATGQDACNDW